MTIRKMLLGTVAASGVMVIAAASEPVLFPAVSQAEAATSVSVEIGFNVFYDRLGSHGDRSSDALGDIDDVRVRASRGQETAVGDELGR